MTFKKVIAGLSSITCAVVLAVVVALFTSVAPSQVASASGGNCKWEGGPGAPTYPSCKTEDCDGRGGTAQCTGGQGAASSNSGPDGWSFSACDEAAPQMWRIAAWCVAAGGTWVTTSSDPRCEGAGPGGGTISSSESAIMSTATNFANGIMGSCGAHQTSDTGWGTTLPPTSLCSPGGSAFSLGIVYRSVRQKVYEANAPCTGSLAISFQKNRSVKCPPTFSFRHATTGDECWKPLDCCKVSNPVSPMSGAKAQKEVDYVAPGDVGLEFVRYYNSTAYMRPIQLNTTMGNPDVIITSEYWRHTYDQHLYFVTGNAEISAIYQGADGNFRAFDLAGHETGNLTGAGTTVQASGSYWDVTLPSNDVERFDAGGTLVSITTRTGRVTTIMQVGCTRVVTGPFGHTLTLTYDCSNSQRLLSATLPDGGVIQYAYDEHDRPTTVTYPDLTIRTYEYGDARNQWLLTAIKDESNQSFAQYTYDDQGRAVSSQHAGGAQAYTFTYPTSNYTTGSVTDPAGKTTQYLYAAVGGAMRVSAHSAPCMDCGNLSSAVFDAQGNPLSRTAFDGTSTLSTFDSVRNLETWRTEAAGTPDARVVTTQWHPVFRMPTQIDEPGQRIAGTYDSNGNLLAKTETDLATSVSRTWTQTFNSAGQVLTIDGPRSDVNDVTTYTYNNCTSGSGCGQLATVTDPAGNTTTYLTYNANGSPLTVSDSNGLVTTYTYDARERTTSIARGSETTTVEYWPTGLVKKITHPDGSYVSYSYDAAHRLVAMSDGLGNSLSYTLDSAGNVTAENVYDGTNTLFRTHSRAYDSVNRLQSETGAASQTTTYGYDDVGNRIATTDPLGRLSTFEFDALRRLKVAMDPAGGISQYQYDAHGNTLSVKDPRQLQTSYAYNGFDNATSQTSPDSGSQSFVFNASGAVQSRQDARGSTAEYTYDAAGRITQLQYADQTIGFTYDTGVNGHGHVVAMTDASGSTQFAYDTYGRLTSTTQTTGPVVRTTGQTYNSAGQLATRTTPSGQVISYTYANGRVTGISVNGTVLISNALYAPFGPTLGWQWGNGTYAVREYDLDGRITSIDSEGLTNYSYNADGTIQARVDDAPSPSSSADSSLVVGISATSNRVGSTTATGSSVVRTYTYDSAGNLTSDGLHTFTYDGAGRLSASIIGGAPTAYTYNGLGQRVKKAGPAGTFYFVYDGAGHLLGQYNSAGGLVEELVWLDDIPVATMRTSPNGGIGFFYIHTDHLNAPTRITRTSDNAVMWRWDHDPYGTGAPDEDADGNGAFVFFNSRFPGQQYDAESGLNYNYYRDGYDPATGRYTQSDPIGLQGGLNTYAYSLGDPVNGDDPSGLAHGRPATSPYPAFGIPGPFDADWNEAVRQTALDMEEAIDKIIDACVMAVKSRFRSKLSRCLDACASKDASKGRTWKQFCEKLPEPAARARCWSHQFDSETSCRGYCFNEFGSH